MVIISVWTKSLMQKLLKQMLILIPDGPFPAPQQPARSPSKLVVPPLLMGPLTIIPPIWAPRVLMTATSVTTA